MNKENFTTRQGDTFQRLIRWETLPYIYKAITGIAQGAPARISAPTHGLTDGWRAAVVSVLGMVEINAKNAPPRDNELVPITLIDPNTVDLNSVNAAGYSPYASGGYLQYYTPVDLTGYNAEMVISDRVGGTPLATLGTNPTFDPKQQILIDNAAKTITITIAGEDTDTFTWTKGVYDLEMVSPSGARTTLFTGIFNVTKDIA